MSLVFAFQLIKKQKKTTFSVLLWRNVSYVTAYKINNKNIIYILICLRQCLILCLDQKLTANAWRDVFDFECNAKNAKLGQRSMNWVTWPTLKILIPLSFSGMAEVTNFKFCILLVHKWVLGLCKECKIRLKAVWRGSRDLFLKFWDPLNISATTEATNFKFVVRFA